LIMSVGEKHSEGLHMYLKVHENARGNIVAACDADLIGKVFEDKKGYLDLDRYRGFYVGEKASDASVKSALKAFGSANLVGKRAVKSAVELGLAGRDDVMYIKGIPYIQIYRI